jgi:hypothetical protein
MAKSWKTTLGGILGLVTIAGKLIINGPATVGGDDIAAIIMAVGLLFAKDHNVTGGVTKQ